MSGLLGSMMTPEMEAEIDEGTESLMAKLQNEQRKVLMAKRQRKAQERLDQTIRKRDKNRRKNKAARQARRKNK